MSAELHACPECAIASGWDRTAAWDVFWMTSRERASAPRLPERAAARYLTVGRADPTWTAVLTCGHAVPA